MEINTPQRTEETLSEMMGWTLFDKSKPHIKYFENLVQHTDEWLQARCGILTASEMKNIITPVKLALKRDKEGNIDCPHLHELLSQRITNYAGDGYQSFDMARGVLDEMDAAQLYNKHYSPLTSVGFITNDKWGFTLGYSPDGLTMDGEGQIEVKSRAPKYQIETILADEMPSEYLIQVQTGLLVTERDWCDFISYSGGLPMFTKRIFPDAEVQAAIIKAADAFHAELDLLLGDYRDRLANEDMRFIPTERRKEEITA